MNEKIVTKSSLHKNKGQFSDQKGEKEKCQSGNDFFLLSYWNNTLVDCFFYRATEILRKSDH